MAKGVYVGKERHPLLVILLGLVTGYIYTLYWFYAANAEMKKRGIPRTNAGVHAVLAAIPVLQAIAVHRTVANLRKVYLANHVPREPSAWSLAVIALPLPFIGPIIASAFVQSGLNHVWDETRNRVIQDGPEEKDLQCPDCAAIFEIRKNPYTEAVVKCPGCGYEGVV